MRHCDTCDYCGLPLPDSSETDPPAYCCFGCRFAAGICDGDQESIQQIEPSTAFGLSVFFTINVVMMTMALWSYAGSDQSSFELSLRNFLRYGAMALSAPVLLLLGRPLFSHAINALRRLVFTTDLLLSSGVIAAFAVSVINTLRDSGHVYYEVGCVILVLVTLGRWLEAAGRSNAYAALSQLDRLLPDTVKRWDGARFSDWPRSQIEIGERVRVVAGERIPVDGRVSSGRAVVDEQFFSGESTPIEKRQGDSLWGGSLNLDGDLVLDVTSPPTEGALGRLVAAVQDARLSKGRYQLLSDAWSQWFFPIIGAVAVSAFVIHGRRVDWEYGLLTSLSVLLIACPCALALATPLAVWTAIATAAKAGVVFRSGEALESFALIKAIRWDKTGTLTTGTPRVIKLVCEDAEERSEVESFAASIAEASNHIFSKAISEFLSQTARTNCISDVTLVPGCGLRATTASGLNVLFGSVTWLEDSGVIWGRRLSRLSRTMSERGPLIAISINEQVSGLFLLEEAVRDEAIASVQACRDYGLNQTVLTGDQKQRASILATAFGIPVEAKMLPQDKLASIRRAQQKYGRVAMVGDGLNDAPALAAADVGIALGCGADVSRESADICLLTSDLSLVPWAYQLSRQTVRTIRTNLAWSFGYNSLGIVVAACGQLHPALAAALMVVSSLMVLGNSLRLTAFVPQYLPEGKIASICPDPRWKKAVADRTAEAAS